MVGEPCFGALVHHLSEPTQRKTECPIKFNDGTKPYMGSLRPPNPANPFSLDGVINDSTGTKPLRADLGLTLLGAVCTRQPLSPHQKENTFESRFQGSSRSAVHWAPAICGSLTLKPPTPPPLTGGVFCTSSSSGGSRAFLSANFTLASAVFLGLLIHLGVRTLSKQKTENRSLTLALPRVIWARANAVKMGKSPGGYWLEAPPSCRITGP